MPPSNDSASGSENFSSQKDLERARKIDRVCDEFEDSWRSGSEPSLETYLPSGSEADIDLFFELVRIDIAYRQKAGQQPDLDRYASQYPQYESALSDLRQIVSGSGPQTSGKPTHPAIESRFHLVAKLGSGSFAAVWKAWDNRLHRWVALKCFHESLSRSSRPSFEREARAVALLDHPNIVRVIDLSPEGSPDFIVFEYVEGMNLKEFAESHPDSRLPPELAGRIALAVSRALAHIHEQGVVHRDLKPENVLVDQYGVPKIVDFGLARHPDVLSTISRDRSILGTVPYMSPEQCRGEPLTAASDIYALGVILYELLAGVRPFQGTRDELLQRIQFAPVKRLRTVVDIPSSVESICHRAMQRSPGDRYPSADRMAEDLEDYREGRADSIRKVLARKAREAKPLVRRSLLVCAGAVALAAVFISWQNSPGATPPGMRTVRIDTEPSGAKVSFVPISRVGRQPEPDKIIHADGATPLSVHLPPGDHLVVARLENEPGRFHEVYRHVPADMSEGPGAWNHLRWSLDEEGNVVLPEIRIPSASVTDSMVQVEGTEEFLLKEGPESQNGRVLTTVPTFYVDPYERTVGEYKRGMGSHRAAEHGIRLSSPDDHAVNLSFEEAVTRAEGAGKRLLLDSEYEFLATARGMSRYPWGETAPADVVLPPQFGPVGFPDFDRVETGQGIVYGLCSNIAEWTDSGRPLPFAAQMARVSVRGGPANSGVESVWSASAHDPRHLEFAKQYGVLDGVGYRAARSARPRLKPEDFTQKRFVPATSTPISSATSTVSREKLPQGLD